MEETINIDAMGIKCPRPLVDLAKASRRAKPGDSIIIVADDLAFESDVKAWSETTGNELTDLRKERGIITATIKLT